MLREKVLDSQKPVIFYELIPPTQDICAEGKNIYADCAIEVLLNIGINIDAINIPEIHDENSKSLPRTQMYVPKIDPREFACTLKKHARHHTFDLVINRCTVHNALSLQNEWLDETLSKFGIHNLILVGGESSKISYNGPSVLEMADYIQKNYAKNYLCGGITIPMRRNSDLNSDEPNRLLKKGQHGLDFFTSQVLYEAKSMKKLLADYDELCKKNQIKPKRIFLSFAPLASRKDLDFLRWLGVEISDKTEDELLKTNIGVGWRSIKIAKQLLHEIMNFVANSNISVPLGLNIEHITRRNFELSQILIEELGELYHSFMKVKNQSSIPIYAL